MNWGYRLLIVILAFAGLMGYLVYGSLHTQYELVSDKYYQDELDYQKVIDGTNNANRLSRPVTISSEKEKIILQLPPEMAHTAAAGKIWFYCATDETRDRHFDLGIDDAAIQKIEAGKIAPGQYTVKINWQANNRHYYSEQSFKKIP